MFRFGDPGGRGYGTVGASQVNLLSWWSGGSATTGQFTITIGGGRNGGNSLHVITGSNAHISRSFDAQAIWGIAFAIKVTSGVTNSQIFTLQDGVTTQCDLRLNSDGSLTVTRNGTVLGTTTTIIPFNVWIHVEWKTKIDNTVGTTEVRINGVSAGLTLSGIDTQNTANASANVVVLGHTGNSNVTVDFDDIIIWDGQANDPQGNPDINDFIGDCSLGWLLPNGAGVTTQFTPDSGNNYARVGDTTPDADASYVENLTVGNTDTYAMNNLPSGAISVKSLAVVHYARKSDTGLRGMKPVIRSGSTDYAFANEIALPLSYIYTFSNWGSNPSGPAAWTPTTVNALETGQKVSS